jgi:haloacetate dehalogenase
MTAFPDDIMTEYKRCFRRPEVIAATCADYRAGATIDDNHDLADLKVGRMIECPTLAFYSGTFVDEKRDPLKQWQRWAKKVTAERVQSGHFIPEEIPDQIIAKLSQFMAS